MNRNASRSRPVQHPDHRHRRHRHSHRRLDSRHGGPYRETRAYRYSIKPGWRKNSALLPDMCAIADKQADIHAMRIPAGEAHLLLGADLVVSAGDDALAKLNREHSYAVINHHLSPTAEFTRNPDAEFPLDDMEQTIAGEVEAGRSCFVDATTIATQAARRRDLRQLLFARRRLSARADTHQRRRHSRGDRIEWRRRRVKPPGLPVGSTLPAGRSEGVSRSRP